MAEIPSTPIIPAQPIYPYDDEYMIFDKATGRYILTEKYLIEKMGIDLSARINERNAVTPSALVNRLLRQGSNMVYNYIHAFNANNTFQDLLIAKLPSLRIDQNCIDVLERTVPELGTTILYIGDLTRWISWIC